MPARRARGQRAGRPARGPRGPTRGRRGARHWTRSGRASRRAAARSAVVSAASSAARAHLGLPQKRRLRQLGERRAVGGAELVENAGQRRRGHRGVLLCASGGNDEAARACASTLSGQWPSLRSGDSTTATYARATCHRGKRRVRLAHRRRFDSCRSRRCSRAVQGPCEGFVRPLQASDCCRTRPLTRNDVRHDAGSRSSPSEERCVRRAPDGR